MREESKQEKAAKQAEEIPKSLNQQGRSDDGNKSPDHEISP